MIEEAIVLVGGLGTRLRSVVKDIPKPLADVRGKPFLWYLIKKLLQEDVKRITLSAGYKADLVKGFVHEFFHNENTKVVVDENPWEPVELSSLLGLLLMMTTFFS